jgi:hypothetical protein
MMKKSPSHWSLGRTCSGLWSSTWCNHKKCHSDFTKLNISRSHGGGNGRTCQLPTSFWTFTRFGRKVVGN